MKRVALAVLLFITMASVIALPGPSAGAAPQGSPSPPWNMRGFNFPSWWHDEYLDPSSPVALERMAGDGANWVAIVPTQFMATVHSNTIGPDPAGRSASDAAVARAIDDAHARGLKVMLKPHIDSLDGAGRVDLTPSSPAVWFAEYQRVITGYARLSEAHGVELFSVGTELASLNDADNYAYWAGIIAGVRAAYGGPLTYAASLNDFDSIPFFGLLDYLGMDFYFPLSDATEPTTDELVRGWTDYSGTYGQANWLQRIEDWQAGWGMPVIFTELGYRSIPNVAKTPWDCAPGAYDGMNQARAYEAAFRVLKDKTWLAGVFWWDWEAGAGAGGAGDGGYTVRDKPAETVVKSWFIYGQSVEPALQMRASSVSWNSFADYQARHLSVVYDFSNTGNSSATGAAITASRATGGVQTLTPLPVALGSFDPGTGGQVSMVYAVPAGITSFRALTYTTFYDITGNQRFYPEALPLG